MNMVIHTYRVKYNKKIADCSIYSIQVCSFEMMLCVFLYQTCRCIAHQIWFVWHVCPTMMVSLRDRVRKVHNALRWYLHGDDCDVRSVSLFLWSESLHEGIWGLNIVGSISLEQRLRKFETRIEDADPKVQALVQAALQNATTEDGAKWCLLSSYSFMVIIQCETINQALAYGTFYQRVLVDYFPSV